MQVQQHHLEEALNLVVNNNARSWEVGYYSILKAQELSTHDYEYPVLDYDYSERKQLYTLAHDAVVRNASIDFFEFGVFEGESFRQWLDVNTHPESRFFGFDSFEGLPEAWETCNLDKGHFSTGGKTPDINDPRAAFIKGFFNKSLRPFLETYEPKNKLVIHIDSDLCSSGLYVLMNMDHIIKRGTLIVFDDFSAADEFAAFQHYTKACGREWRIVGARKGYGKFAVVMTK